MRLETVGERYLGIGFFIPIRGYELDLSEAAAFLLIVFYPNKGL